MTAERIDGAGIARQLRAELAERTARLAGLGHRPGLAVVLVGDDPASHIYVRHQIKACEETGIRSVLPAGIPNHEGVFRAIEVICPPGTVGNGVLLCNYSKLAEARIVCLTIVFGWNGLALLACFVSAIWVRYQRFCFWFALLVLASVLVYDVAWIVVIP